MGKKEELRSRIRDLDSEVIDLQDDIEELQKNNNSILLENKELAEELNTYKFFISRLKDSEYRKTDRKRLIIDIVKSNKPYTIDVDEIINDVKNWLI